jgi:hypothetical protein
MTEIYEIHKTLCEGIDNKKKEDIHKVLNTICKAKTEKRKIATFDEALEKSGTKISGMTDKIKEEFTKKWEKGEPIYINDRKLNIPGKEEKVFEEIRCDINRIGEVKGTIEEMKILKNMNELMECK